MSVNDDLCSPGRESRSSRPEVNCCAHLTSHDADDMSHIFNGRVNVNMIHVVQIEGAENV